MGGHQVEPAAARGTLTGIRTARMGREGNASHSPEPPNHAPPNYFPGLSTLNGVYGPVQQKHGGGIDTPGW